MVSEERVSAESRYVDIPTAQMPRRDILELRASKTGAINLDNLLFVDNNSVIAGTGRSSKALPPTPEDLPADFSAPDTRPPPPPQGLARERTSFSVQLVGAGCMWATSTVTIAALRRYAIRHPSK